MQRERITDDIYVFVSERYAQVTAGVVRTDQGAVVIDTLAFPEETQRIRRFVHDRLDLDVLFVVNTHFHADHTTGTCFFERAQVIAHHKCRDLLDERGRISLEQARSVSPEMQDVSLVLPNILFDSHLTLHLGNKTLRLWSSPGHSPDSIMCLVEEDQVLFAADTLMPLPYFVDGDYHDFLRSLRSLQGTSYEHIVQGHGEVILRGEVEEKITGDIDYLNKLGAAVETALMEADAEQALAEIDIETCGKSRILLNGMVEQLHRQNVLALAAQRREEAQLHDT